MLTKNCLTMFASYGHIALATLFHSFSPPPPSIHVDSYPISSPLPLCHSANTIPTVGLQHPVGARSQSKPSGRRNWQTMVWNTQLVKWGTSQEHWGGRPCWNTCTQSPLFIVFFWWKTVPCFPSYSQRPTSQHIPLHLSMSRVTFGTGRTRVVSSQHHHRHNHHLHNKHHHNYDQNHCHQHRHIYHHHHHQHHHYNHLSISKATFPPGMTCTVSNEQTVRQWSNRSGWHSCHPLTGSLDYRGSVMVPIELQ